ncbi:WD40 repeat-like protein [Patellaria atrata CBS 101060]|uniref:WD40 repeat-like protein n=1 Tax=Patellaria atrata CBS 101060 TaxID=1346257 RepID=A0A9P4SGQ3_9PEZI|nr:WD40 repeat-like protein [Patellaria atrata CBS 101060]
MGTPFNKIDEGFSEDTRSQSGSDLITRTESGMVESSESEPGPIPLPSWILNLSEAERSEFTYAILRSLRTSSIAAIVERLNPLLHLDPVNRLPSEIIFAIFSFLPAETLLLTSSMSKAWRLRALDSQLWKQAFHSEGWVADMTQIRAFEASERSRVLELRERRRRVRRADLDGDRPSPKKRVVQESGLFGDGSQDGRNVQNTDGPAESWVEQHGVVEADDSIPVIEDAMQDVDFHDSRLSPEATTTSRDMRGNNIMHPVPIYHYDSTIQSPPISADPILPPVTPTLLQSGSGNEPRVNWQYLYKQKRRLEDNWNSGRYVNFQLPHPNHMEEAHGECVYTIQFSGNYLVSGSRDKTVRIWNLETQRLMVPPLTGHKASVLCLQFDERPEQDIVISGGSDNNVILWQFSTGKLIRTLTNAHTESVLNLRFDDRHLITCSKDKTIKVWNRNAILPTDEAYPKTTTTPGTSFPPYIVNMFHELESQHLHFKPLKEYSLMMTLNGHSAAVNAIQILDGQIVSASGDRTVKVWDVRTGICLKTFVGHIKGIACVQFDGRRIVSGSSDNTVRIFDRVTGAEVACLQGHASLVRTVQARFGDHPGNEDELEAEARAVDQKYFEAMNKGTISTELTREHRRARNAGSKDPKDIFAYGAKLPPGGGGSRWARIVSGSYDETVIIWKKDSKGKWVPQHELKQSDAVRAASGTRGRSPAQGANTQPGNGAPTPMASFQQLAAQAQAQAQHAQALVAQAHALHAQQMQAQLAQLAQNSSQTANAVLLAQMQNQNNQGQPAQNGDAQPTTNPAIVPLVQPQTHHHPPHHHHHHHGLAMAIQQQQQQHRVFKLQFDSRRIICCSQDPTIVGWDFANNDRDIVGASRFFGEST